MTGQHNAIRTPKSMLTDLLCSCMNQFTAGQITRLQSQMRTYRGVSI